MLPNIRLAAVICCTFALVCTAVLLSSCGKKSTGKEVHVIEFMNWETSPEGSKFISRLIKEFEEKNPGIKIKNVVVPPGPTQTGTLLTRFGGGVPPDIFEIQAEIIHPFLRKQLLLDLTPYMKKSKELAEKDFLPISLMNFRYDGKDFRKGNLYGLPKDIGTAVLIYNKDMFDKAGLAYPNDSWTLDDYLDAARKLTRRDSSDRALQIGIDRPLDHAGLGMALQYGGSIWSPDYKQCLLNSDGGRKAFQFLYDVREVYKYSMKYAEANGGMISSVGFRSGNAGMSTIYRYELPDEVRYIGNRFQWDVARLPAVNGKRTQLLLGPTGWSVCRTTKYPEDCFKFLEFIVGKKGQIESAKLGWNIPSNKGIALSNAFLGNLHRPDSERINRVFLSQMNDLDAGLLNPYIPMERVFSILSSNLDPNNVRKSVGRVDAPLEKAVREINAIIEENAAED